MPLKASFNDMRVDPLLAEDHLATRYLKSYLMIFLKQRKSKRKQTNENRHALFPL